jgi:Ca2+-transporting ATPase
MTMTDEPTQQPAPADTQWYSLSVDDTVARLGVDAASGLSAAEVTSRVATYGKNEVATEPPPTTWQMAKAQIANPMNIMLLIVSIASFTIDQIATGAIVMALVLFNVIMGTNQERKAMASVDALAQLQVPMARVRRDGTVEEVDASGLVPGDILLVEAGDLVPADARIISSATLEVQEAALTGESGADRQGQRPPSTTRSSRSATAPTWCSRTPRSPAVRRTRRRRNRPVDRDGPDRQHGHGDEAVEVAAAEGTRRPHQGLRVPGLGRRRDHRHRGIARGRRRDARPALHLDGDLGDPDRPAHVRAAMLSSGAQRLAESKAVVKSLTDVETLGGTTVINSDKTGTLTMNAMTSVTMLTGGSWYKIEGSGYAKSGAILGPAGDDTRLHGPGTRAGAVQRRHRRRDESIIGDPTEAALVVLAAKIGVDAEETRRSPAAPSEVPFDSEYKFMATFHDRPVHMNAEPSHRAALHDREGRARRRHRPVLAGAVARRDRPDGTGPPGPAGRQPAAVREGPARAAFAARPLSDDTMRAATDDPMSEVHDLVMISLVGIIDPLRPSAAEAVRVAHGAGIDVRMITGDHTVTARAIADQLGLGPGVITGADLQKLSDDEVKAQLPELHVFGRVAPEDKVRLARLMQEAGRSSP